MSIESYADWKALRGVGRIVRLTLDALEQHAREGVTTGELDDIAAAVFATHGARSAPSLVYGFPGTVLISVNDEVVHDIPGSRRLRNGARRRTGTRALDHIGQAVWYPLSSSVDRPVADCRAFTSRSWSGCRELG